VSSFKRDALVGPRTVCEIFESVFFEILGTLESVGEDDYRLWVDLCRTSNGRLVSIGDMVRFYDFGDVD
jgi:hypothetical protein